MRAVTNSEGKVAIDLQRADGDKLSFTIGGIDGMTFPPGREVEIEDERLNAVIEKLCRSLGFGPEDRVWG